MSAPDLRLTTIYGGLPGKVAVVTGGGIGIGKMIAATFVQNGMKVYIASRKQSVIDEAVADLNKMGAASGGKCVGLIADLTTKAACQKLADQILAKEPKIHVLFNNSGVSWGAPMTDFPEEQGWDKLFALNVKSMFYMTVALLPGLKAAANGNQDPARVINITSTAGVSPMVENALSAPGSGTFSYAPSKAAGNHLTRVMAASLAKDFITVNAIAPGVFPSRMTAFGIRENGATMVKGQPMGRIGMTEDMGGVALFLISKASAHTTGMVLPLSGGTELGNAMASRI
ncbi:hypothetical protein SmJEL517_g02247 [Synchytrium microbalum]|uniref:Uncharacterized protein n=1 Tax=Synchytrium microbalum TaxID=1806994 RepID=A0A507C751_9FUNG|nr:uncharacterized protein SmJEL517_g02247 [Synchytrium microbalum]TPX35331.1 hypothetical protein SmJEL517_g02247 [Synchytrium microbalum]